MQIQIVDTQGAALSAVTESRRPYVGEMVRIGGTYYQLLAGETLVGEIHQFPALPRSVIDGYQPLEFDAAGG